MKKTTEENKNQATGINEKREKALKGKYQKPEISNLVFSEKTKGEWPDMASEIFGG